jgi:NaMN:DMB phosphoribosyltransferase
MGIANTTASAALIAVFTGADPATVTGRGTGIDDLMHRHKVSIVRAALDLHRPDPADPIGALAAVGGLEHAALAGFLLAAAALRTPVILDGVIAGAAALVAAALHPGATAAWVAGHRSAEPGHAVALDKLGCARWWRWTYGWARGPGRCWPCPWYRLRPAPWPRWPPSTPQASRRRNDPHRRTPCPPRVRGGLVGG